MSCIPFEIRKGSLPIKMERTHGVHNMEVQLWREKGQFIQQREDEIREATLVREEAEANRALVRETTEMKQPKPSRQLQGLMNWK